LATGGVSSQIVQLFKRIHLGARRAFDEALAEYGLTGPQAELIGQICMCDGIEQRTIQERLGITSPTLTGIIDGLVERDMVERRISPDDARVKQLFLTPHGRQVSESLPLTQQLVAARLLNGFSAAECSLLKDWLSRVAENLDAHDDGHCG
jgi:MarR family transcriptional regulator for hemolysin